MNRAEDLLTPGQAARILGRGTETVARWADRGRLTARWTPGGHRRYLRDEVEQLAATLHPDTA